MLTHQEVINYLRDLGRGISRNAENLSADSHPMAAYFACDAEVADNQIEAVVSRLIRREEEQRAEFEAAQPSRGGHDREDFHAD